jgi:hypothetical protein
LRYFLLVARGAASKRQKALRRYGWSLQLAEQDPRVQALSSWANMGLRFARELAEDAAERSLGALRGDLPERLTAQHIAREHRLSPFEVYDMLRRARIELFGKDLSDSAIYYRLRRDREHGIPTERPCAEPGCPRPLPAGASRRRRYCDFHLAPHARVRRYRARQKTSREPRG